MNNFVSEHPLETRGEFLERMFKETQPFYKDCCDFAGVTNLSECNQLAAESIINWICEHPERVQIFVNCVGSLPQDDCCADGIIFPQVQMVDDQLGEFPENKEDWTYEDFKRYDSTIGKNDRIKYYKEYLGLPEDYQITEENIIPFAVQDTAWYFGDDKDKIREELLGLR